MATLLVIDDEPGICAYLNDVVTRRGWTCYNRPLSRMADLVPKLLVIEDDPDFAEVIFKAAEQFGWHVVTKPLKLTEIKRLLQEAWAA